MGISEIICIEKPEVHNLRTDSFGTSKVSLFPAQTGRREVQHSF